MLQVKSLRAGYTRGKEKRTVLNGLSFALDNGQFLAVLGPSGCGKTTLLKLLAGVLQPDGGEITFENAPLSPKRTAIGFIPQGYGLLPWKTVRDNCIFSAQFRGVPDSLLFSRLAGRLGLTDLMERYPGSLSGGQAQRVALARALLTRPRLLLLDEPFSALDIALSREAQALCLALWRENGGCAVAVTHRLKEALYLADQVAVMGENGNFLSCLENPWQGKAEPSAPEYLAFSQRVKRMLLDSGLPGEGNL